MTDTNNNNHQPLSAPASDLARPVLFVHASGRSSAALVWVESLLELGLEVYSHRDLPGCLGTRCDVHDLPGLAAELGDRAPGRGIIMLRAPLAPTTDQLAEIEALLAADPDGAFTGFSNSEAGLNPFAGLHGPSNPDTAQRHTDLVAQLGRRELHPLAAQTDHLLALGANAARTLADSGDLPGPIVLADWIYLHDPTVSPWNDQRLDPHESRRPLAWGSLSERLHEWLATDAAPDIQSGSGPVTLHITHSWGGGVAQWVDTFIQGDSTGRHLQLRSEGPQSGQGAGQRLSLYAGRTLECAVDSWWLQPPIKAVENGNAQYAEALDEICKRFGVGRIIVSSLVGHSIDALATGLPTIQVLHDHFPAWPLLSGHPSRYGNDLEKALADRSLKQEFPGMNLPAWRAVQKGHLAAIKAHGVVLTSPSQSVADIQHGLDEGWSGLPITLIPHGFPPMEIGSGITPIDREDGRLRLVIPGRVQAGKGADLLREALPALTRLAQVWLLGTGKGGETFFGLAGVNVVVQYERADLPGLMRDIGPHLAALLSVVPETFSYTLSEMNAMGVPVLATRMGAFVERVEEGVNGFLADPEPAAVVSRLEALASDPEALAQARRALEDLHVRSLAEMVADYDALCPARPYQPRTPRLHELSLAQAQGESLHGEYLRQSLAVENAAAEEKRLRGEVRQRTQWAKDVSVDLENEIERRKKWVASLEAEIDVRDQRLDEHREELARTRSDLQAMINRHEALEEVHETVLNSSSWRITKPLRVGRRVLGNIMRARAWNPFRWPLLLSQMVRNLATVGLRGTLLRMQDAPHAGAAPEVPLVEVAPPNEANLPATVPHSEMPQVSVVIPVYNQLAHTATCLRSLAEAECHVPFELILVDDESGDDSPRRLPEVEGLHYLRNEKNLGFIGSCNRGAEAARGEFIVFLNNDTEVRDGWLDALVNTFEQRSDAGLVGARLLYPDGRLQECGGLVFNDGSGWNYGRGDDPALPRYRHLRETDYCSGACIMLRHELFQELGGFDTHYAPAYYEDTDLAFKVREHGLKVYVQPASTVIHFEGATSGTDLDSGAKRYQVVNREKFRERWADALANQPRPIEDPNDARSILDARDHRLAGRVLVIDAYTPEPDQDSGSVRLTRMMTCLQDLGHGVAFLADNRAWAGHYTRALQEAGVEAWYGPWADSLHAFLRVHGNEFDTIIISRHYVAVNYIGMLRKYCPDARFVFDTVDLHYLREQRLAELEDSLPLQRVAKQTRRSELSVIEAADATLVVSPAEVEVLAKDAPGEIVHVLSNIHEVPGQRNGFEERSDLFFVGGYQHPPNIDAATWFVNDIWPLVHAELPDARFHLVGSKAPDSIRALHGNGVEFHGFVESMDPFLDRCRLAVAPLRYGAGVKGKVNHSMAHGQPVVATPMAVEGMHAEHERDVLVAPDAESFAAEIVRLYSDRDLWNQVSKGGVENVRAYFSTEAAKRSLQALFETLDGR